MQLDKIYHGDAYSVLETFDNESVDCIITSPPYWQLRSYGDGEEIGQEIECDLYISHLFSIFAQAHRVLKSDGTFWLNIGDTYSGWGGGNKSSGKERYTDFTFRKPLFNLPKKSLMNIPSRVSIGLQDMSWVLRNEIIWHKPNAMPNSVKDRFTVDFEKIYFFTKKSSGYYFNQQMEPMVSSDKTSLRSSRGVVDQLNSGRREKKTDNSFSNNLGFGTMMRNKRTTWHIPTESRSIEHFATFPMELVETCIEAGCKPNGVVLDMFVGSGTTAIVAKSLGRHYIGIDKNEKYVKLAEKRLKTTQTTMFAY